MKPQPLKGIRVVELARILAGPWCGQVLADLGAEVIKVEAPGGDDTRAWGPPFVERHGDRTAAYFYGCNRGKTSVTADFRNEDDLRYVKDLISSCDVVIENFKVGGLEKYGLDYASLSGTTPSLVYCSVTGFGQTGPRAKQPGYDLLIQGMSGVMDITGDPEGAPQKMGVAFADIFSGLYAAIGIEAALLERTRIGQGQHLDISLLDSMTGVLANQAMNYFATGNSPKRGGNRHANLTPYETIEASDGHIIVAVGNDSQFKRFCTALDLQDALGGPDYETNALRLKHQEAMMAQINARSRQFTKADLIAKLTQAGVPGGPINTVEEALADPQIEHRKMRISPEGLDGLRLPIVFSNAADADTDAPAPAPTLGARINATTTWSS
ncbi:CaiB/BaiF CoA-transferase family protein [uncultured Roseobacter sp.]|uniref:CaiB/BaiF CoA transferase family protein n=1 Tax=uncultured Roseobacter sp. TaxID=114847 RepID=UPI002633E9E3|nr:CaiB/BaiF CoA-transferase family protein [uncultured Roseobacter sp.]